MTVLEIIDSQNGSVLLWPSHLLFFYLSLLVSRMKTLLLCLDIIRFNWAVHSLVTEAAHW